ncbi:MAG: hypothetical protein GC179_31140 [Anaerolineaceae bacterium]|nr:hypothetical protein [Anaerolineaceae bacterium]
MGFIKNYCFQVLEGAKIKTMTYRSVFKIALLLVALFLASCAPEDLDITPTPVPTAVPIIKVYVTGAVKDTGKTVELPLGSRVQDAIDAAGGALETADLQRVNLAQLLSDGNQVNVPSVGDSIAAAPTPTVEPTANANDPKVFLDKLVALTPENMSGGAIQWRRDAKNPPTYAAPRGGNTVRVSYTESGGSLLELTYGIFPDADTAKGFYDTIVGSLQSQSKTAQRDEYPTPNQFGSGTYGSAGIFLLDTIVVRIAIPRYNTVAGGDPVKPLVNDILSYVEQAKGS